MNIYVISNLLILIMLLAWLIYYGINLKIPYPKKVIEEFDKPFVRCICYIILYLIAIYNPILGLLSGISLLLLHLDYLTLINKTK